MLDLRVEHVVRCPPARPTEDIDSQPTRLLDSERVVVSLRIVLLAEVDGDREGVVALGDRRRRSDVALHSAAGTVHDEPNGAGRRVEGGAAVDPSHQVVSIPSFEGNLTEAARVQTGIVDPARRMLFGRHVRFRIQGQHRRIRSQCRSSRQKRATPAALRSASSSGRLSQGGRAVGAREPAAVEALGLERLGSLRAWTVPTYLSGRQVGRCAASAPVDGAVAGGFRGGHEGAPPREQIEPPDVDHDRFVEGREPIVTRA